MRQIFFCVPACNPRCNPSPCRASSPRCPPGRQAVTMIMMPFPRIRRQVIHAHGWIFLCWGKCWDVHNPPAFFLPSTALIFPLTSRHHGSKRPPSKWRGFGLSPLAGHSPRAEHTAATATQSRNPSRFSRASLSLPALANAFGSGYKKGQGVQQHPPPGGTVPRNISFQSFLPL